MNDMIAMSGSQVLAVNILFNPWHGKGCMSAFRTVRSVHRQRTRYYVISVL